MYDVAAICMHRLLLDVKPVRRTDVSRLKRSLRPTQRSQLHSNKYKRSDIRNNEREAEGSGNVVFEKDVENFMDGEKE